MTQSRTICACLSRAQASCHLACPGKVPLLPFEINPFRQYRSLETPGGLSSGACVHTCLVDLSSFCDLALLAKNLAKIQPSRDIVAFGRKPRFRDLRRAAQIATLVLSS